MTLSIWTEPYLGLRSLVTSMTHPVRDIAKYSKLLTHAEHLIEELTDPTLLLPVLTQYKVLHPSDSDLIQTCFTWKGWERS